MHFEVLGGFPHSHDAPLGMVRMLNGALRGGDFPVECVGEAVPRAAFDLSRRMVGIHHRARIDDRPDLQGLRCRVSRP